MAGDIDFTGKTALITGAASGIGAACAGWPAARGAERLILVDRNGAGLSGLAIGCETACFVGDVGDSRLWEQIEIETGPIDHAVVNAGMAAGGPITETPFAQWREVLAVNLDGAFLSLRTALRLLPEGGSVVLTASVSGLKAEPNTAAYAASKAALIQLARVAAKESAPRRIRVNAIAPGGVDTPIWDGLQSFQDLIVQTGSRDGALAAMARLSTPLGRFAPADEIAGQIGFLLSDMAANITGAVLVSDGGYSI